MVTWSQELGYTLQPDTAFSNASVPGACFLVFFPIRLLTFLTAVVSVLAGTYLD
jgi:hypothetical protein